MPRRKHKARSRPKPKRIMSGPIIKLLKPTAEKSDIYPGRIVAVAEYREGLMG